MSGHLLSLDDRAHFLRMMRRQTNSAIHRRMNVLLLLDDGWTVPRIAQAFYIDETTVADHRSRYMTQGRAGIERLDYTGGRSDLSAAQCAELSAHVDAVLPRASKEVVAWTRARFGVDYTPNAMTRLLKRLGFVFKKPKCVPAKADEAVQRQFAEEVLLPLMQTAGQDAPVYFVDATHPAHTGRPAHGWIRKGKTCELRSNHGRTRLNINGALCWHDLSLLHREEDKITSAAMIALFADIEAHSPKAQVIHVIIDNARYNHSRELKAWLARDGCRIQPVYLPSYAPNLNLIERFWRFMKSRVLANRYHPSMAEFRQAFHDFFAGIDHWRDDLRTLLTPKFHYIGAPQNGIL